MTRKATTIRPELSVVHLIPRIPPKRAPAPSKKGITGHVFRLDAHWPGLCLYCGEPEARRCHIKPGKWTKARILAHCQRDEKSTAPDEGPEYFPAPGFELTYGGARVAAIYPKQRAVMGDGARFLDDLDWSRFRVYKEVLP